MKKFFWPIIVSISLSLGILLGGFLMSASYRTKNTVFTNHNKLKLNRLIDFIEQEYVDEVDTDSIVNKTVSTILEQLDPHSIYIAKDEMQAVSESMQGSFVGIGVNYYFYQDSVAVIRDIENGPAEKAGIIPGDRILSADGVQLYGKGISTDSIVNALRGEENTIVNLQVYRKKEDTALEIAVIRKAIPLKSVDISMKLDDGLGYIKINRFSSQTYTEFREALKKLIRQEIEGLIIDLRDNGGGYMDQAIKMLDELVPKDQTVVKTINKRGKETISKAGSNGVYKEGKLYVLVNENSASASEIIAGAVQDNDRGTIVGRRTFGKGLVQRELLLGDGSAIRLTTARYYTPSGRSIQKPYSNGLEVYNHDFISRYERGELYAADSIKIADSLQFKTRSGRVVYGGGGIVPDIFVPIAKNHGDDVTIMLMKSGLVSYFVFQEIDKDRNKFDAMTKEKLINFTQKNKVIYSDFKKYLAQNNLYFKLDKRKDLVMNYLVAEFINQLFGEEEYYRWLLSDDPMIQAVK
ncbi:S41 family peptidase [Myroides indicus]|uniref:Carboxyl-terminal processing protease n=1 Tax=Myroides indicus TaxID=1323422 RepID=A0A4R7EV16_9FLAO|nr:S41 family peptidase [Myroides indicus]TDS56957.1 carboxyl-terminal processing protease [Myroides indicus]